MTRHKIPMEFKKAQREGKLSGVFGRLGDLGTIGEEYDRAISSGCGYLDFIVVDTVENGEKCLQYLRDHKLGKASLICLDRVTQQVERART